jgi:short-subunit dehydrogenase involved in D-alanine esterification of teichoic acids
MLMKSRIIKTSPDIDCVLLNAGVQHAFDLADPAGFNLERFQEEMTVNFSSLVALTHAFLPFLSSKQTATSFILSVVPADMQ